MSERNPYLYFKYLDIFQRTRKAVFVKLAKNFSTWLPLSQIQLDPDQNVIAVRYWIVREKNIDKVIDPLPISVKESNNAKGIKFCSIDTGKRKPRRMDV